MFSLKWWIALEATSEVYLLFIDNTCTSCMSLDKYFLQTLLFAFLFTEYDGLSQLLCATSVFC